MLHRNPRLRLRARLLPPPLSLRPAPELDVLTGPPAAAVTGLLTWLAKKLPFRKPKPEYITRAEFHAGLDATRDCISASYLGLSEKIDANHKELVAAVTDLAQKTELRLDHLQASVARLDERART